MTVVDSKAMRETLRYWASGVSVVTTQFDDQRGGVTVSAFNSLSVDPPQILVCLNKTVSSMPLIQQSGIFAVNILAAHQLHLSDLFGGRVELAEGADRFDGLTLKTDVTGAPIFTDCLAYLDCRVKQMIDGDTHWLVIGEVLATAAHNMIPFPLVYYNRKYRALDSCE
ncbi:MAG: flavin reductase family protein [bacterium]|nr:flavin reductase family protein [bacterium]